MQEKASYLANGSGLCRISDDFRGCEDHLDRSLNPEGRTAQSQIIIFQIIPFFIGIEAVVMGALFILFFQKVPDFFLRDAILMDSAVDAVGFIRMYEYAQPVFPVTQQEVSAAFLITSDSAIKIWSLRGSWLM